MCERICWVQGQRGPTGRSVGRPMLLRPSLIHQNVTHSASELTHQAGWVSQGGAVCDASRATS
jgi:hypothetical protein